MTTTGTTRTRRPHWSKRLPTGACNEAVDWARKQRSAAMAWATCKRSDWMLWLLGSLAGKPGSDARKPLVLCACDCAELAAPYWRKGDDRPAKALGAARDWARGGATTIDEVRSYAANAARAEMLSRCADIVRQHYPRAPRLAVQP